ncbi:MAG: tetratricopeptide repeat protein [Gallionella sp.]|nr:tetratricopeptide repeat protein [Gallionella sp.]
MSSVKYLIAASLMLTACAHAPQQVGDAPAHSDVSTPVATTSAAQIESPVLPKLELTDEMLYEYLLAEVGNQRGYKELAVEGSMDLATKTRDPRLAKRAAQLAFESGDMVKAVTAFKLWQELDPGASLATRMLASLQLRGGKLAEAQAEFAKVLKEDGDNAPHTLLQIQQLLMSYPDKAAALKMMRELAAPYPKLAESHWAVAKLAQAAGDDVLALGEVKQARSLRTDWVQAVSLEAELLLKTAPQQGLQVLKGYLKDNPEANELRLQYARALVEQQQYPEARAEFQRVSELNPDNPDLAFAIALISLQMQDLQGAESQLKLALENGKKDQDTVQYYLGQLGEAKKSDEDAISHYGQVKGGEHLFAAKMRQAFLLNRQHRLGEARKLLHDYQPNSNEQRAQISLIEAQLLRDDKQYAEAYAVLQKSLDKLPNQQVLLYEAAMMADKIGKYEIAEKYLRKLMQLNPEDANAYNALGYSFLERNVRIAEGVALVEKALRLAPEDIAIMDSVGWGYFRSGKLAESVQMLRRAHAANPDPEIAAHLGEALWAQGEKAEAKQLLQDSLKAHPDSEQLQSTIKRLIP